MSQAPFVVNPELTAVAIGHKNREYIADRVLPRAQVSAREFKYGVYNVQDSYLLDNDLVGRKGQVKQVEFGATETTGMVYDYGLEDAIPQADIDNARTNPAFDPRSNAVMKLSDRIQLNREKRASDLVMNIANYNNNTTISGTDQWTNAASKPLEQLFDAINSSSLVVRPNLLTIGQAAAVALQKNPDVIKAFNGTTGSSGLVPLSFVSQLLDIEIVVGRAKYHSGNKGQALNLSTLWSGGAALTYSQAFRTLDDDLTFGITAEYGSRVAGSWEDRNIGLRGGEIVRVGESVNELVISKDAGYFLANVI